MNNGQVAPPLPVMAQMAPNPPSQKPNKPIKATEIKAYLHAWCTKQGIKPEYVYESDGKPPRVMYSCKMSIPGYDFIAQNQAKSKKDAQTGAAWTFSEYLVSCGKIARQDLPVRETTGDIPESDNPGGWTVDTARQRLNRFCTHHGIACNITNEVQGTPQARMTTARVSFCVPPSNQQITVTSNGPNKKNANAKCALAMIRELFKMNLIERRGEPEKRPERNRPESQPAQVYGQKLFGEPHGTKRKAENQVDDNGNWNKTNCVERLNTFKDEMQQKDSTFSFSETTLPDDANFKCVQKIEFGSFNLCTEASSPTEEEAKRDCSLQTIAQLVKAELVEANKRTGPNAKRYREGDDRSIYNRATSVIIMPKWGGSGRMTPWDDRHIKAKLMELEPSAEEKNSLIAIADEIEEMLKKISDDLESQNPSSSAQERTLVGVMRVGAFARGLLLKGEDEIDLVVSCREKPTQRLLAQVYQCLVADESEFKFQMQNSTITAVKDGTAIKTVISFTSPKFQPNDESPDEPDPSDMLPREKCLESLAETVRTLFFQTKAPRLLNCIATCRILKDICRRDPEYNGFQQWLLEMFVIRAMSSVRMPETVGDCLRRAFSIIASGLFLPGVGSVPDENNEHDLLESLTVKQRHSITFKAQENLRFLTFRRIHEVIETEKIATFRKPRKNGEGEKGNETPADIEMAETKAVDDGVKSESTKMETTEQ